MPQSVNKELLKEISHDEPDIQKLEILINECSDVNLIDEEYYGASILQEIIFLLGYGRDINNLITLLIEKGASLNYQDWFGDTALHKAIHSRSPAIIKLLLSHGANPNLISFEDHESALDFAQSENFMTDRENDSKILDEIIKIIIHYNGMTRDLIFCKSVDTYLYVSSRYNKPLYPTGLFTLNGNIYPIDIPNIDKGKCDEFTYWLLNGPANWLFEKEKNHPLVLSYSKRQREFVKYFRQLLPKEIIVGDDKLKVAEKICNLRKNQFPIKHHS